MAPIAEAGRLAAGAVLSGPAGGVAGSIHAARLVEQGDLIAFDMGGTSTDISLIVGGRPTLAGSRRIAGHTIALNSLDIASIGAGGGSIARVDGGGILHVGPQSAGAVPGPACYGGGGRRGDGHRRQSGARLSRCVELSRRPAAARPQRRRDRNRPYRRGARRRPLEAAQGIHRVVDTNMAEGVRLVSVRRGVDPQALRAARLRRRLGPARRPRLPAGSTSSACIVPRVAAVLSAWGMLATDLRFEVARSHIGDTRGLDGGAVKLLFAEIEAEALARLRASFDGPARAARSADMRYGEQVFEIAVRARRCRLDRARPAAADRRALSPPPSRNSTPIRLPDQETVLVNARVAVAGILSALPQEPALPEVPPTPPRAERRIWLDGWVAAPVWDFDALAPGQTITGPAIVESAMTTVLLRPGDRATVTPLGWLEISLPTRN